MAVAPCTCLYQRVDQPVSLIGLRIAICEFSPRETLRLQPYSGSAWRGAFGYSLKRLLCRAELRPCTGCPQRAECLYPSFFAEFDSHQDIARPYVLAPAPTPRGGMVEAGDSFRVTLTLLPSAGRASSYAIRALIDAAESGLTSRRTKLALRALHGPRPIEPEPPPPPDAVKLRFITPLRLSLQHDLLTARTLAPKHLINAAIRRLIASGFAPPSEYVLTARTEAATLSFRSARLGWLETTRRSSRQQTKMQLGGIIGEAIIDLRNSPATFPLLWAAAQLHLGKGTSMGFGGIDVEPL